MLIISVIRNLFAQGLLQKAFHIRLDLNENNFAPLKIILIGAMCWLTGYS